MNAYFAYIRVSTVKQGEHGSSLQEQRDAIRSFASRNNLCIRTWFEERETAAKFGRREFSRMISALRVGKASGVIFHKIDRSARNLRDWSAIQDLADQGIDVRFTQESVNLRSNEGKLTGDFLAVISAHYIRNLREEVKKGIRGRLKQGLYPLAAPVGYLDQGGGKPKVPDPVRAPFVRQAFELYGSGFSLHAISDRLYERGFRGRTGNRVGANRLSEMLRNPFYAGVIRLKRSGENYPGIHEPLIGTALFQRVQAALNGKRNAKVVIHDFAFRRMIRCARCSYHTIGERQKEHVYYRCHQCPGYSIREERVEGAVSTSLAPLMLQADEIDELRDLANDLTVRWKRDREDLLHSLRLQTDAINARLRRLTDIYLDGAIERRLFEDKKLSMLMEQKALEEQLECASGDEHIASRRLEEYLELVKTLPLSYVTANCDERRKLLKTITSNLSLDRKNLVVELKHPFREIANVDLVRHGAPVRDKPRIFMKQVFELIVEYCKVEAKNSEPFPLCRILEAGV